MVAGRSTKPLGSMDIANWAIVTLAAIAAGTIVGFVFGFGIAAHKDILSGVRPNTTSRLLLLMCRPSRELSSTETLTVFAVLVVWLVLFLALIGAPIVVADKLVGSSAGPVVLAILGAGVITGRVAGRKTWKGMANAA
jgi:hypothetical protein